MTIGKLTIFIIYIFSVLVYFLVNEKPELWVIIKLYKYKIWHSKFFEVYIIDSEKLKEV